MITAAEAKMQTIERRKQLSRTIKLVNKIEKKIKKAILKGKMAIEFSYIFLDRWQVDEIDKVLKDNGYYVSDYHDRELRIYWE